MTTMINTLTMMLLMMMMMMMPMASSLQSASLAQPKKPHVIFFVADDLGWNDVGWHNPHMRTPNLDRYAHQGVILNASYVQYFCSPSRNSFMTGYFPYHTGLQHQVIIDGKPMYLPLSFTTLPQLLKKAGYATHIVGKWHLGMCNWKYTPTERGFDSFFGYYSGTEDYYTHKEKFRGYPGYDLRQNKSVYKEPDDIHFNHLFTKHALNVIAKHDPSTPLYLYLPFHLVHAPLQVPEKYSNLYPHVQTPDRKTYCGMVSMLDESFGNITKALEEKGLLDNALMVFTTDNGGPVQIAANNWPLRGGKKTFWEGGTRGAAFAWSKNLFSKTGYVSDEMMHAVDWFPTILKLAGLQPDKKIDGVNQWNMLSKGGPSNREEFVYNIDTIMHSTAIRWKDYKLMTGSPGKFNGWYPEPSTRELVFNATDMDDQTPETDMQELTPVDGTGVEQMMLSDMDLAGVTNKKWKPRLYNIREDPEERHDLSASKTDLMKFMMKRLKVWMQSNVKPQNPPMDPRGNPKRWGGIWTPGWC